MLACFKTWGNLPTTFNQGIQWKPGCPGLNWNLDSEDFTQYAAKRPIILMKQQQRRWPPQHALEHEH